MIPYILYSRQTDDFSGISTLLIYIITCNLLICHYYLCFNSSHVAAPDMIFYRDNNDLCSADMNDTQRLTSSLLHSNEMNEL